jgi:hypothetical protein
MRPSNPYIASLSTTGLLVALAILLLVVVSALMAFREHQDADRAPGTSDVVVDLAEPARGGALGERVAARAAGPAPSTSGVVVTRAGAGPAAAGPPGSVAEVLGSVPRANVRGAPTPASPPQAAGGGGGIAVGGNVEPLVDPVSPEAGDALSEALDQVGGAFPREGPGYER